VSLSSRRSLIRRGVIIAEALQAGEQCVCDLRELVGSDLSTVSKHLTVMREAGLLEMEKRGQNVYYRLRCPCLLSFFECVDSLAPVRRTNGKK